MYVDSSLHTSCNLCYVFVTFFQQKKKTIRSKTFIADRYLINTHYIFCLSLNKRMLIDQLRIKIYKKEKFNYF